MLNNYKDGIMKKETFWYSPCKPIRLSECTHLTGSNGVYTIENPPENNTAIAIRNALSLNRICHYTNIDSLLKILKYRQILFNRIDRVNDLEESKELNCNSLYQRTFIACFNHSEDESIPLWHMYSNKGIGARISYVMKKDKSVSDMFDKNTMIKTSSDDICFSWSKDSPQKGHIAIAKWQNIIYSFDEEYESGVYLGEDDYEISYDYGLIGAYKDNGWKHEEETRCIVVLSPFAECSQIFFLLLHLDTSVLDRIEVIVDPWMEPEVFDCIKHEIDSYELEIKVECKVSRYTNKICRD